METKFWTVTSGICVLSMERTSYHPSGAYNFVLATKFLEKSAHPCSRLLSTLGSFWISSDTQENAHLHHDKHITSNSSHINHPNIQRPIVLQTVSVDTKLRNKISSYRSVVSFMIWQTTEFQAVPHKKFSHTSCMPYPIFVSLSRQHSCFDDKHQYCTTCMNHQVRQYPAPSSFRVKYLLERTNWQRTVEFQTNTFSKWHFETSTCNLTLDWYE
jgi:hypothetical protein